MLTPLLTLHLHASQQTFFHLAPSLLVLALRILFRRQHDAPKEERKALWDAELFKNDEYGWKSKDIRSPKITPTNQSVYMLKMGHGELATGRSTPCFRISSK